jgi:hypothetical protein
VGGQARGGLSRRRHGTPAVLSRVFVGGADLDRALAFYRALMPVPGIAERLFCVACHAAPP